MRTRGTLSGVAAVLLAGGLVACGGTTGTSVEQAPAATTEQPPVEQAPAQPTLPEPPPTTEAPPSTTAAAKIGTADAHVWDNGLRMQVLSVKRVVTTDPFGDTERFVAVTVQVYNGSPTAFEVSGMEVSLRYGKAGEGAESTYPMSDGYDGISGESIRPGSTATGKYAFTLPAGKALPIEVEVAPGYTEDFEQYDPGHFEGTLS